MIYSKLMKKGMLILLLSFITNLSFADQIIIPFNNPTATPMNCMDTWIENGISQQLIPIPPATGCFFDYSGGDLWLFPARLTVDLAGLGTINSIAITFSDYCGSGCTSAEFFEAGNSVGMIGNMTTSMLETMTFTNPTNALVDFMTLQSFEGQIHEILIDYTPFPTECDEPAHPEVWVEQGDVYIEDACYGVILTSPAGLCYRVRVDDNGGLITEPVVCP